MRKNTLDKVIEIIVMAVAVLAVACIVSMIMLAFRGFNEKLFIDNDKSDNTSTSSEVRLQKTPDFGEAYIKQIVFLGDHTISGMASISEDLEIWSGEDKTLPLDYSINTATIVYPDTNESLSIASAIKRKNPDYIIITLGIDNGVAYCSEKKFKEYYTKLILEISEASPNTKIMLQSIFPVSDEKQKAQSSISNRKIDAANTWIEELCEELSLRYLNTACILMVDKGNLSERFDSSDGINLNSQAYAEILYYIRTHGYN